MPFIVGIEIRLSNAHKVFDICDNLKGKYPKDFKFAGWHPQCMCYQVPLQMTDDEFDKYEDQILGRGEFSGSSVNEVSSTPAAFKNYLQDNRETLRGYKTTPYWVKDNPGYAKIKK